MIKVEGLTKKFGNLIAVDQVSFEVNKGEVLGFLGPNGAGKSTSMRMLAGYLPPDDGRALIDGVDVALDPKAAKAKIGYLPESAAAYRAMTVTEFLGFVAGLRGIENPAKAIGEVLEKTQLLGQEKKPIGQLSKGYRQRVGFAQALVHDPPVLILDEPTDGLDPNQKAEVRKLIRSMAETKAILLSTHILEEMEAVCDRAILLAKGQIVGGGTTEELLALSSMHGAVAFELARSLSESEEKEIAAIDGAASLERDGAGYLLRAEKGQNLLGPLHKVLTKCAAEPVEIQRLKGRMDEVFRKLTLGEDA